MSLTISLPRGLPVPTWVARESKPLCLRAPVLCHQKKSASSKNLPWHDVWPLTNFDPEEGVYNLYYRFDCYFDPNEITYWLVALCRLKLAEQHGAIFGDTVYDYVMPHGLTWIVSAVSQVWVFDLMEELLPSYADSFAISVADDLQQAI